MDAETLIDLIERAGEEPQSYSGRGMYGRKCVGVVCKNAFDMLADISDAAIGVGDDDDGHDSVLYAWIRLMRRTQQDSMGRDIIIYWPSVEWPEEEDVKDLEEERLATDKNNQEVVDLS